MWRGGEARRGGEGEEEEVGEGPAEEPLHLLALPNSTLSHVLGCLRSAGDLARCAAACKVLRELVASHTWGDVAELKAQSWGPRAAAGLAHTVQRCPNIVSLDLSGLGALGPEELGALCALPALRELRLADCWRLQVGGQSCVGLPGWLQSLQTLAFCSVPSPLATAAAARCGCFFWAAGGVAEQQGR